MDDDNKPVAGVKYRIVLPDSSVHNGELGEDGLVRFDNIAPGQYRNVK